MLVRQSDFGRLELFNDPKNAVNIMFKQNSGIEIIDIIENKFFDYPFDFGIDTVSEVDPAPNWGFDYLAGQTFHDLELRGRDIRVAIIDSGIDTAHPCFRDLRLVEFVDIDRGDGTRIVSSPFDSMWHGTFCAAILAGKETNGLQRGLATESDFFIAKVFNEFNSSYAAVYSALEWCIEKRVHIVSISMGAGNKERVWLEIVQRFLESGGIIVAGIGNEFNTLAPTIAPGNYPFSGIVAVGAHDIEDHIWQKSGGAILDWSDETGETYYDAVIKPDVVAPGVAITSIGEAGAYRRGSGTSFATPHVAGVLACLWGQDNLQTRDDVLNRFSRMVKDDGAAGHDVRFGKGRINITSNNILIDS
jgi:subtilisin